MTHVNSLPRSDPKAILYWPALTAAIEEEISGAPFPRARNVTAAFVLLSGQDI